MAEYKIAVIGGRESVLGFKALGLEVFAAEDAPAARRAFIDIAKGETQYAIIYITERYAVHLAAEIDKLKDRPFPAVVLIPDKEGTLGLGQSALQSAVERAVGADIL